VISVIVGKKGLMIDLLLYCTFWSAIFKIDKPVERRVENFDLFSTN